jgi:uridine kinase
MNKKNLSDIYKNIDDLMKRKEKVIVAIEGNSAAGKSTLAYLIEYVYDCNIFHMDDYFLTPELKTRERMQEVGGNVDYVRFKDEIVTGINSRRSFSYWPYDCKQMRLKEPVLVEPKKLNVIEGSYSMHPTLSNNYDLKIFLQIGKKEQKNRILKRNGELMYQRYIEEWIPKENTYFLEFNIKEKCDMVI